MELSHRAIYRSIKALIRTLLAFPCKSVLFLRGCINKRNSSRNQIPEQIVVSMTSWSKRIDNVSAVIESILRNTVLPDKIVLNLSLEEFPNREKDLPASLVNYQKNKQLEILWQEGNTRAFKKFIPTMKKYPNDVIIAIDDDFLYPEDLIETFVNKHKEKPYCPLSGNDVHVYGEQAHCGCASLVKGEYFGKYIDDLMDENAIIIGMDDIYYTFCVILNGLHYEYVGKPFFINMTPINPVDGLSSTSIVNNDDMRLYLAEVVRRKYHIHMTVLSKPFFFI